MSTYRLVLESGPQRKRTFAQVQELPGCVFNAPTTGETVAGAPDAILTFLRLLARHGEGVDADASVEVEVVKHVTDSKWIGFGGPEIEEDLEPLSRSELERGLHRAEWMRADMIDLLAGVSDEEFDRKPERGRPIRRIVEHVLAAEYGYVRRFGKIEGIRGPGNVEEMDRGELMEWMGYMRAKEMDRLRALTDAELAEVDRAGSQLKTARAYMRKLLAHQYEHLLEIAERLGKPL